MLRLVFLALITALPLPAQPESPRGLVIHPAATQGRWDGWGVSLCWWAGVFGDRDDLADALFTTQPVRVNEDLLPGLGLNIVRYNAGACSWNAVGGEKMAVSKIILRYRQMEGFWLDPAQPDPASSGWNWSVDAKQRLMMEKSRNRGVDHFELFANSPMWWMTRNRNPSGGPEPDDDNLAAEHERNFAIYLATIARKAATDWGIRFSSVSPFNEPLSDWWFADCKQEGCHFSTAAQARLLPLVREELDRRGLKDIPISASEETHYDHAIRAWESHPPAVRALIGQVNVHGYQEANGDRTKLHRLVNQEGGRKLWNSEYGDGEATGLNMARNLHRDFLHLKPTSWSYWQAVDGGGWGLIAGDLVQARLRRTNPKWHTLAQYTRHIRRGAAILTTGDESVVAAHDIAGQQLTLVCLNDSDQPQVRRIDLSRLTTTSGQAERWITRPTEKLLYRSLDPLPLDGRTLVAEMPPKSVQTLVIRHVTTAP